MVFKIIIYLSMRPSSMVNGLKIGWHIEKGSCSSLNENKIL